MYSLYLTSTYGDAPARSRKELPSARWRQERRYRSKLGDCNKNTDSGRCKGLSTPLDMSTRARCLGPPPSYAESVLAPSYRPSVIACVPSGEDRQTIYSRRDMQSGMCDPVIDEHFRRSLGKDYVGIFSNELSPADHDNNNQDSVALIGLSVDDHFAKALGDTWRQLQSKEGDEEARTSAPGGATAANPAPPAPLRTQRAGVLST
ncbi:transcription cofactor vestigial-like protein 4 isoform X2 [Bacillus rossius redtenbacheri]|uniref:transcription cofactor vestigial-like protein 4 isoform X2 n=1 Tax=Bacillus rossius redtenbacheri TaxID=93214 RepID=UPI002FDCC672